MKLFISFLLHIILIFFSCVSFSQNINIIPNEEYKLNTWSLSILCGPTQFYGDLREYEYYPVNLTNKDSYNERSAFYLGFAIQKQISYLLGIQFQNSLGTLKGMKREYYFAYFKSNFYQSDLSLQINLKGLLLGSKKLIRWKIDLLTGVGLLKYNSTSFKLGTTEKINQTRNKLTLVTPLGLSIDYQATSRIDFGINIRQNKAHTDDLDATLSTFSTKDQYVSFCFSLTYKLGKDAKLITKNRVDEITPYSTCEGVYHLRYLDPYLLK